MEPARVETAQRSVSPRAWLLARAALLLVLTVWPMLFHWSALHALEAGFFLLAFVWLPGRALVAWTLRTEDALERAFLSWSVGAALLGVFFLATAALDLRGACWILPLVSLPALVLARRARPGAPPRLPAARELWLLALVIAVALARTRVEFADEWFLGFSSDNAFHSANAAEFRWNWPLQDPRLAGEPLRYHFLSYAAPAALARLFDLPARECLQGLSAQLAPVCLALGVFTLARSLGARSWIACLAALAFVAHVDLGAEIQRWTHANWSMRVPLEVGIYGSSSTSSGLCLLLGLLLLLRRSLAGGVEAAGTSALLVLLALAASATKASVLPPLIAGLAAAWLWKLARGRGFDRRLASATVLLAAAALPVTLWLVLDKAGFAQTLFSWAPGIDQRSSGFEMRIAELVGATPANPPGWLTLLLLPLWLLGFLGAAGVALAGWCATRERGGASFEYALAFTLLAGLVPSWLLTAPGSSQMFFGYDSILCATALGALGVQRCLGATSAWPRVLLSVFCAAVAVYTLAALAERAARPSLGVERIGAVDEYRAGLDWMRAKLPPDAVLLTDDQHLCLGMWSERRMFYDTPKFSAQFHVAQEKGTPAPDLPFAARERAEKALLENPSSAALAEVRKLLGSAAPLFAVRSRASLELRQHAFHVNVPDRAGPDALESQFGLQPLFQNRALAVYRLPSAP